MLTVLENEIWTKISKIYENTLHETTFALKITSGHQIRNYAKRDKARLFLVCDNIIIMMEVIGQIIIQDKNILGIKLGSQITKISQFADDATLVMKNNADIINALNHIESFSEVSGLKQPGYM